MPTELEIIQASLNKMQDLVEVTSHMQRRMQDTDEHIVQQKLRAEKLDNLLASLEKEAP